MMMRKMDTHSKREPPPGDQQAGEFVGYIGNPDLHDASISAVRRSRDEIEIVATASDGRPLSVTFRGVQSVKSSHPEGMMLYALVELKASPPLRRFVFVNWDENDSSHLEISATEYRIG
jgi:hypothetical protein